MRRQLKLNIKFNLVNLTLLSYNSALYPQFSNYYGVSFLSKVFVAKFRRFQFIHRIIRKKQVFVFFELLIFSLLTENYVLAFHLLSRLLRGNRQHRKNFQFLIGFFKVLLACFGKSPVLEISLIGRPAGVDRRTA